MKRIFQLAGIVPIFLFITSCIQDEPLNAEADILECHMNNNKDLLVSESDTVITITSIMNNIEVFVRTNEGLTACSPEFKLTDGATIYPLSGSVHDFSQNKIVKYTVTSEDGKYNREYNVSFNFYSLLDHFSFENYTLSSTSKKYHVVYEVINDVKIMNWWGSGNPGFSLASTAEPEGYPTSIVSDGYEGKALKLTTCSAGAFGALVQMPIAPGNLFLGTFDVSNALKAPLTATRFGIPFNKEPQSLTGRYKYKAGNVMTDKYGKEISGTDTFNIYAILYENTDENGNPVMLDGTNATTSPYLVAMAEIDNQTQTDEWTEFSIPFVPKNSKTIDSDKLSHYGYNISIVFCSSKAGDIFQGAVGSTLMIDEVDLICK